MIGKEFLDVSSSRTDEIRLIVTEFVSLSFHDFCLVMVVKHQMVSLALANWRAVCSNRRLPSGACWVETRDNHPLAIGALDLS